MVQMVQKMKQYTTADKKQSSHLNSSCLYLLNQQQVDSGPQEKCAV